METVDCQQQVITLLSKITVNLPGMIFQIRQQPDGSESVVYISPGCWELCELAPEAVQADFHLLHGLIYEQDRLTFRASMAISTSEIVPWCWSGRMITPSGKLKWIQGNSQLETQPNGDIIWYGLIIDISESKQAEAKLSATESRYQAILAAIPDLMFRISRDGKYLDLKEDGVNLILPKAEVLGKNLHDLLPSDVADICQEAIAKTLDTGILQTCEYQLLTPWAGMRDYEARLVVSGKDEVLAIVRDITERKQAEIALQNLAQKFSTAFSCSPDSMTISTLEEGRFLEVNDSFVRLSGYQREQVLGRTALELNIWIDKSTRQILLQQLKTQKVVTNLEMSFRHLSGEIIIVLLSAEIIDLNGIPCLLAVHRDITERKQVEAQIRLAAQRDRILKDTLVRIRSSLKIEDILQNTVTEIRQFLQVDRVFVSLNNHRGTKAIAESVNPEYPSVLDGSTLDQTYVQEFKTALGNQHLRVVEDITQVQISAKIMHLYQQFQVKAILAVPIILGNEFLGALIANQCANKRIWQPMEIDLVQQMSAQLAIAIQQSRIYQELEILNNNLEHQVEERTNQLQQKMQELKELHQVKDVVLHTVTHDLRTSVMGNLMVLKHLLNHSNSKCPKSKIPIPISRSIIERMIQGNDRQLTMLDSLLEIHANEKEGITLHRQLVKFSSLLMVILTELQPLLHQNQATLTNLCSDDLPLVMVDISRLQKVLANLFTHSLQHNPPGLNLTITAKVEGGMIHTQIQDHGLVMSKLECECLFDLHVRDPQSTCSTGIGLKMYLCRQIIQAHGGEIGVISNHQDGLNFWFTLPLES